MGASANGGCWVAGCMAQLSAGRQAYKAVYRPDRAPACVDGVLNYTAARGRRLQLGKYFLRGCRVLSTLLRAGSGPEGRYGQAVRRCRAASAVRGAMMADGSAPVAVPTVSAAPPAAAVA